MGNAQGDQLQMLFPTVVQVSEIESRRELNERLLTAIYAIKNTEPSTKPSSWSCDLYTTIGSDKTLMQHPAFAEFGKIAYEKVMKFADALKFDTAKHPPKINECWLNVYGHSHAQEIHVHQNSVISGIYYVKAPPGCAPTLFHSPACDVMLEPPATERNAMNNPIAGFEAVAGRMLLFRSSVRHSVLPSVIQEERITVAFNATM